MDKLQITWLIGFVDSDLPWYWKWMTKPGFQHIFAMRYDPVMDVWIFVEWSGHQLHVELYRGPDVDAIFWQLRRNGHTMVSFKTDSHRDHLFAPLFPIYCVSWAKHLVGLRSNFIYTPHQLYKALLKAGGQPLSLGEIKD